VPEIAIKLGGEVSPAAFRLFCYYCARRNNESGGWRVKNREAAEALGISRSRVSEARKELRGAGWIADEGKDFIRPLMGFQAVESSTESVEFSTAPVESSTESVEFSTGDIDKDRARGSTSHLPPTLPPTTPRPRVTPTPQSANAGVSVGSSESRFSLEERKAHAAANGLKGGWLTNSRDGRYDEMIADQLARRTPEAVEQALATPTLKFKSHSEALMHVSSVVSRGGVGSEPVPEIERLFESGQIDEETRARLLARAWSAAPPRPHRETTPEHSTVTRLRPVAAQGAA